MQRMKETQRKVFSVICVLALSATLLTGCGGNSNSSVPATQSTKAAAPAAPAATKEAPLKVTMLTQLYGDPPAADNRLMKYIQDFSNSQLDITWSPSASYTDKFTMTIASGQMPMTMLITDDRNPSYLNACSQGAFWDITPYVKDYPNLYGPEGSDRGMWENSKINGKNYLIPRSRTAGRAGLMYRKDWLDNLGMKAPTNLDELYTMLKAFTLNDPDKNGKNDTFGLALDLAGGAKDKNDVMVSTIASYFGASTSYGVDDKGKVHPAFEEKEYIDSLKWLKKLYDEKIINQDFAIVQDIKQAYSKGNVGSYFNTSDDIQATQIMNDTPKNAPGAITDALVSFTGPKGIRAPYWSTGYFGGYVFPKSTVKTEADLKKLLTFFDKIADPAIYNLLAFGIEGVDYTKQNNTAPATDAQRAKYVTDLGSIGQLGVGVVDTKKVLVTGTAIGQHVEDMRAQVLKFVVLNPVMALVSPSLTQKGADLNKLVLDARIKFIMGAINEAGYMDEVKKWHASGGDQACTEFTDQLAKLKK